MRRPSEQATTTMERLHKLDAESGWFGKSRHCSDIIAGLVELASLQEPASLACISRFLFSNNRTVRLTAQDAVAEVILEIAPLDLLQLSDAFGWEYEWYLDSAWTHLKPSQVCGLARTNKGQLSVAILGLLSFHRSGYVREEAVRQLSKITEGTELPFILIRQNDWVESISRLARSSVQSRLAMPYIEHFTKNIGLVTHLPEFGRNDLSEISDAIISQLLLPEHDELLKETLRTSERATARRLVKHGFERLGKDSSRLARHGMAFDDAIVRLCCARQLLSGSADDTLIEQLIDDAFAPVRREAYQAKSQRHPDMADKVWAGAAFDRSSGIRDLARFQLKKYSQIDVRRLYLDALQAKADNFSALAGLAECAMSCDVPLLRQYLHHTYPSRRKLAIAGLVHILGNAMADELVELLSDDSPAVAKQAERSLKGLADAIDGKQLFAVLERSPTHSGQHAILRLFYEMGKWRSLPWLIRSTGLQIESVNEQAEMFAYWWLVSNRVFTQPSKHEKQAIVDAYRDVCHSAPESLVEKLQQFLPFELA